MQCPVCGSVAANPNVRFCNKCGAKLVPIPAETAAPAARCPVCGIELADSARRFCTHCGAKLGGEEPPAAAPAEPAAPIVQPAEEPPIETEVPLVQPEPAEEPPAELTAELPAEPVEEPAAELPASPEAGPAEAPEEPVEPAQENPVEPAQATPAEPSFVCPVCGTAPTGPSARFCRKCGCSFTGSAPAGAAPAAAPQPAGTPAAPKQKHGKTWLLVLGAVVLMLAVGSGTWLALTKLQESSQGGAQTSVSAPADEESPLPADSRPMEELPSASALPGEDAAASEQAVSDGTLPMPEEARKHTASATSDSVVLRNALPNSTTTELRLAVDGQTVDFDLQGVDAVVPFAVLNGFCAGKDWCQAYMIARQTDGSYLSACLWINCKDYQVRASSANAQDLQSYYATGALDFGGSTYGAFAVSGQDGCITPTTGMVNTLNQVYYRSYLDSINNQSVHLAYSTAANTETEGARCISPANSQNTYDAENFTAFYDSSRGILSPAAGQAAYQATFRTVRTRRDTNEQAVIERKCDVQLLWENGVWKINALTTVN